MTGSDEMKITFFFRKKNYEHSIERVFDNVKHGLRISYSDKYVPNNKVSPKNPRRLNQEYFVLCWNHLALPLLPIISAVIKKTINAHIKQISIFNSIDNKWPPLLYLKH